MWGRILMRLVLLGATIVASGLIAATMVRLAPGFNVDEQQLDSRLNEQSREYLRQQHAGERNIFVFYGNYLGGMARGEFGTSRLLGRPVGELIRDRAPVTAGAVFFALIVAWALGLGLALLVTHWRIASLDTFSTLA